MTVTWLNVREHLGSRYSIIDDKQSIFTIMFQDGLRKQRVFVSGDDKIVTYFAPFALVGHIQPGQVLQATNMFGVSPVGELYCLQHLLLTASLDATELEVPLRMIAAEADRIEKEFGLGDNL
jgi:hypothetical protein